VTGAAAQVGRWALHDRPPLTRWRAGRVTVLGDAAHPMLPFMAQGANQAVEDAVELARVLARTTRRDVPAALAAYAGNRAPRTAAIQAGSRQNAAALHLVDGPAQLGRDRAMALASGLDRRAPLFGH
jgi:salicylate hydroxylase